MTNPAEEQAHAVIMTSNGDEVRMDADTAAWLGGRAVWLTHGYPRIWNDGERQYLHRRVMDAPEGVQVDHIDGDPLNCTRANLRLCTHAGNQHNRGKYKNNSSGRKGVSWHRQTGKWQAKICLNYKTIYLGLFTCIEEAAAAYDAAARELHREFAKTNEDLA
jgi:hypothetical protein